MRSRTSTQNNITVITVFNGSICIYIFLPLSKQRLTPKSLLHISIHYLGHRDTNTTILLIIIITVAISSSSSKEQVTEQPGSGKIDSIPSDVYLICRGDLTQWWRHWAWISISSPGKEWGADQNFGWGRWALWNIHTCIKLTVSLKKKRKERRRKKKCSREELQLLTSRCCCYVTEYLIQLWLKIGFTWL